VTRTLTKTLIETALKAEMTDHLGYEVGDRSGAGSGNNRNGTTGKTVARNSSWLTLRDGHASHGTSSSAL
jgi:transposase-like protein